MYFLLFISEQAIWQNTSIFFQEFKTMSKSTLMKKVIENQNVFRGEVMVGQEVIDGIQRSISYIKDELQNSIENNLLEPRKKGK